MFLVCFAFQLPESCAYNNPYDCYAIYINASWAQFSIEPDLEKMRVKSPTYEGTSGINTTRKPNDWPQRSSVYFTISYVSRHECYRLITNTKQIDFRQYRPPRYSRNSDRIHRTRFRLVSDVWTAFCWDSILARMERKKQKVVYLEGKPQRYMAHRELAKQRLDFQQQRLRSELGTR